MNYDKNILSRIRFLQKYKDKSLLPPVVNFRN